MNRPALVRLGGATEHPTQTSEQRLPPKEITYHKTSGSTCWQPQKYVLFHFMVSKRGCFMKLSRILMKYPCEDVHFPPFLPWIMLISVFGKRWEKKLCFSSWIFCFVLLCFVLQRMGRHSNEWRKLTNSHFKPTWQLDFEFSSSRRVSRRADKMLHLQICVKFSYVLCICRLVDNPW